MLLIFFIFLTIFLSLKIPDSETLARNFLDIRLTYHMFEREKVLRKLALIENDKCQVRTGASGREDFENETVVGGKLFTVVEEEIEDILDGDGIAVFKYVFVTILVGF